MSGTYRYCPNLRVMESHRSTPQHHTFDLQASETEQAPCAQVLAASRVANEWGVTAQELHVENSDARHRSGAKSITWKLPRCPEASVMQRLRDQPRTCHQMQMYFSSFFVLFKMVAPAMMLERTTKIGVLMEK